MLDEIVKGFYTQLATYSGSYNAYNIIAPQTATLPYVTFGLETDRPIGDFGDAYTVEDLTFWVNCFSKTGQKAVGQLADLVLTVMDGADLTVVGYNHLVCKREFIGTTIYDLETGVFQIPMRYRIWENKA